MFFYKKKKKCHYNNVVHRSPLIIVKFSFFKLLQFQLRRGEVSKPNFPLVMSGSEYTEQSIAYNINELYNNNRTSSINSINDYLLQFQKSSSSWNIILNILLTSSDQNVILFLSSSLKHKCKYDIVQYNSVDLYYSIIKIIKKVINENSNDNVMIQLIIALAYTLPLLNDDNCINNCMQELLNIDNNKSNVLLIFLKVLPEEINQINNINELLNNNNTFYIEDLREPVLKYISQLITNNTVNSLNIIDALKNWVLEFTFEELISFDNNNVINFIIRESSNVNNSHELLEHCLDLLGLIIIESKEFTFSGNQSVWELINIITPIYNTTIPFLLKEFDETEDLDILQFVIKFICECLESWERLIIIDPSKFAPYINLAVELTFPSNLKNLDELEFRSYLFKFWIDLQTLSFMKLFQPNQHVIVPIYLELFNRSHEFLKFNDNNINDAAFKSYRNSVHEFVISIFKIISSNTFLNVILQNLQKAKSWQSVESNIFILQQVSTDIKSFNNDSMLEILSHLLFSPIESIHLLIAINILLTKLVSWTNKNYSKTLESQLNFIFKQLDNSNLDHDVLLSASNAFMSICMECNDKLQPFIDQLLSFYSNIESLLTDTDSKMSLNAGITSVIFSIPDDTKYYNTLQQLLKAKLFKLLEYDSIKEISLELQTLSAICEEIRPRDELSLFKNVQDPFITLIVDIYPNILEPILLNNLNSSEIIEKWCDVFHILILNMGYHLDPILQSLLTLIDNSFKYTKDTSLLSLSAKIMDIYSITDTTIYPKELIDKYYNTMIQFVLQQHETFKSVIFADILNMFNVNNDISEVNYHFNHSINDYVLYISDTMIYFPYEFLTNLELISFILKFLMFISINNPDPSLTNTAIKTMNDLFSWGLDSTPITCDMFEITPKEIKMNVKALITNQYIEIFNTLFHNLLNKDDEHDDYDVIECFCSFIKTIQSFDGEIDYLIEDGITHILNQLNKEIVNHQETKIFIHGCYIAGKYKDYRKLGRTLTVFTTWYSKKYAV